MRVRSKAVEFLKVHKLKEFHRTAACLPAYLFSCPSDHNNWPTSLNNLVTASILSQGKSLFYSTQTFLQLFYSVYSVVNYFNDGHAVGSYVVTHVTYSELLRGETGNLTDP